MEEELEKPRQCLELVKVQDPRQDTKTKDEGIKDGNEITSLRPGNDKGASLQDWASSVQRQWSVARSIWMLPRRL